MAGKDLAFDTESLDRLRGRLQGIRSDLECVGDHSDAAAQAAGFDNVAHALRDFTNTWDERRKKLRGALEDLETMISTQVQTWHDVELGISTCADDLATYGDN